MKNKARIETIGQMLEVANDFTTITNEGGRDYRNAVIHLKAMYKKFSDYNRFAEHLSFLFENDLLAYRKYERRYRLTERGLRFLRLYTELHQMISVRQTQGTSEQKTFGIYEWPYQVTNLTETDERPSTYGVI